MVEFDSVYGSFISQYIAFKRSLGYKYTQAEFRFRVFDRFAVKEKCEQVGLTKDLFEKWMEPIPNEQESNRYRRVNELINFSRYLNDLGIASYCPRNIPHIRSGFSPYIFTHDEISRFFAACDENLNWGRYPTEFVYTTPALFRLLYGTGLRISEALHLETEDVHLDDNYLLLRNTKNNTERMVPFPPRSKQLYDNTVIIRKKYLALKPSISLLMPEIAVGAKVLPTSSFAGSWYEHKYHTQKKGHGSTIFGTHLLSIHLQRCHLRAWICIIHFLFYLSIWDIHPWNLRTIMCV